MDEKPPDGNTWSSGGLTRKQTTSRPDTLWPEIWRDMSDTSKQKKEAKVGYRKNGGFDIARKLRGIYLIDPADEEFKDVMKKRA